MALLDLLNTWIKHPGHHGHAEREGNDESGDRRAGTVDGGRTSKRGLVTELEPFFLHNVLLR